MFSNPHIKPKSKGLDLREVKEKNNFLHEQLQDEITRSHTALVLGASLYHTLSERSVLCSAERLAASSSLAVNSMG